MVDPWSYADKTKSEHAEQVALFMWANMAERYGVIIADDPHSYTVRDFAKTQFENAGKLGYKKASRPLYELKWLHAISNHGKGFGRQAEGVKAGVSDISLPVPMRGLGHEIISCGLYMELKRKNGKMGDLSDDQIQFLDYARKAGYTTSVAFGWVEARGFILHYLDINY
jgi:hypothetical protein